MGNRLFSFGSVRFYGKMQKSPEGYVLSAAHILHAVASCPAPERMATLRKGPLTARLDAYLSDHFTQKPGPDTTARTPDIGRTQLYTVSNSRAAAERISASALCVSLWQKGCSPSERTCLLRKSLLSAALRNITASAPYLRARPALPRTHTGE